MSSSVPTKDDILVPETLLKKRKSQEKARAERTAEAEKKKKVSHSLFLHRWEEDDMMHKNLLRLDRGQCCCKLTIFRV